MSILANSNAIETGGYQISRSVRLRSSANGNFTRTPSSATNRRTWTWSAWVKVSKIGSGDRFIWSTNNSDDGGGNYTSIQIEADKFRFYNYSGGAFENQLTTATKN